MSREEEYYNWLLEKVHDADFDPSRYSKLMQTLYNTEFTWTVDGDENRAADGLELRNEFADTHDIPIYEFRIEVNRPCSMLEMMVALACRTENQIMEDLFVGPRFGRWMKAMLSSLGLRYEMDGYYDDQYVDYIITSFMAREYNEDGDGGLFRIRNHEVDMRKIEIWMQMNWYLRELLEVG